MEDKGFEREVRNWPLCFIALNIKVIFFFYFFAYFENVNFYFASDTLFLTALGNAILVTCFTVVTVQQQQFLFEKTGSLPLRSLSLMTIILRTQKRQIDVDQV